MTVWDAQTGRPLSEPLQGTSNQRVAGVLLPRHEIALSVHARGDVRGWRLPWVAAWQQGKLHSTLCGQPVDPTLRLLNAGDIRAAPWLEGREGEDVCSGRRRTEAPVPAAPMPSSPGRGASQAQR